MLSGRYGPYVSHNKINATVPKGKEPASLTMDEAVALIAERIEKGGGKKPARKAKAAPKPKAEKSAAAPNGDGGNPAAKRKSAPKKSPPKKTAAKPTARAKAKA